MILSRRARWEALAIIERAAGLAGYLLRPLSARLLAPTIPEQDSRVDREKLLAISGRGRRPQLALAKKFSIGKFPSPAGGCLLTDPGFSERLKILLTKEPQANASDMELLKYGRHIWQDKILYIIGRDHEENLILKKLARQNDLLAEATDIPGPIILVRNYNGEELTKEKTAGQISEFLIKYNNKAQGMENLNIKWQV